MIMTPTAIQTPPAVMGLYDQPLWESIRQGQLKLQRSKATGAFIYPPAPVCPETLSPELEWTPVCGRGEILSWVIYHKQYLPAYPAPYNVIAVRLEEGPVMISNLQGPVPDSSWIGRKVRLVYASMPDGAVLPRFELSD
jgi:uncharacterized OB-fold protein